MTAPGPLIFPGSRALAGWWQQLLPVRPRLLWVGHLLLHGVEALAWISRPRVLDPFNHFVLQALTLGDRTLSAVDQHVHLGLPVLGRVLVRLRAEGLVQTTSGNGWLPTALGRHALERGVYPVLGPERRRFVFVQSSHPVPPQYLQLPATVCVPHPAPEDWIFDPALLHEAVRRPLEWKQRRGFPLDVEAIIDPPNAEPASRGQEPLSVQAIPSTVEESAVGSADLPPPTPLRQAPPWQRVVLHRAEQLLTLLVALEGEDQQLLGYAVQTDGGTLSVEQPLFRLGADSLEVFPELSDEPSLDIWRQAWRVWCQQRQVPAPEAEACVLERGDHRLRVRAEKRLIERLSSTRNEVLRGQVWLQAGVGRFRTAALVEVGAK